MIVVARYVCGYKLLYSFLLFWTPWVGTSIKVFYSWCRSHEKWYQAFPASTIAVFVFVFGSQGTYLGMGLFLPLCCLAVVGRDLGMSIQTQVVYMYMSIATASSTIHPPTSSNTHIQAVAVSYLQANPQLEQQILMSKSSEATQSGDQATISRITGGCLCTCGVYTVILL